MRFSTICFFFLGILMTFSLDLPAQTINISCDPKLSEELEAGTLLTETNCEPRLNLLRESVITNEKGQPNSLGLTLMATVDAFGKTSPAQRIQWQSRSVRELFQLYSEYESAKSPALNEAAQLSEAFRSDAPPLAVKAPTEAELFEAFHRNTQSLLTDYSDRTQALQDRALSEASATEIRTQFRELTRHFSILTRKIDADYLKFQKGLHIERVSTYTSTLARRFYRNLDAFTVQHSSTLGINAESPITETHSPSEHPTPRLGAPGRSNLGIGSGIDFEPSKLAYGANMALLFLQLGFELYETLPITQLNHYIASLPEAPLSDDAPGQRHLRMAMASQFTRESHI